MKPDSRGTAEPQTELPIEVPSFALPDVGRVSLLQCCLFWRFLYEAFPILTEDADQNVTRLHWVENVFVW